MVIIRLGIVRALLCLVFIVSVGALSCWGLIRSEWLFKLVAQKNASSDKEAEPQIKELQSRLEKHIRRLAVEIGPRSYLAPKKLEQAAAYVKGEFEKRKRNNSVRLWPYRVGDVPKKHLYRCVKPRCMSEHKNYDDLSGTIGSIDFKNIEFDIRGDKQPDEIIVIGAHYDSDACESAGCTLGADDNATGVAALIELVGIFTKQYQPAKTLRFVAFTNEEEPFFQTETMGSYVYAREPRAEKERVRWMLSLETMGYFNDKPGSQEPQWLAKLIGLPTTGNFIAFAGNWNSAKLAEKSVKAFSGVPAVGIATYSRIPGVNWSDHWSYWQLGVPAVMVSDTALLRNFCYHKECDIPQRLDFNRLAHIVLGLADTIKALDQEP